MHLLEHPAREVMPNDVALKSKAFHCVPHIKPAEYIKMNYYFQDFTKKYATITVASVLANSRSQSLLERIKTKI